MKGGREGGEGRGGEGRGGEEGREGGRVGGRGGRERRDECYTYSNGPQYLNSSYVTYYVITCQSAFEYNNDVTYYVITSKSPFDWVYTELLLLLLSAFPIRGRHSGFSFSSFSYQLYPPPSLQPQPCPLSPHP